MFGLSFTEVLIIAALALILLGPEQLPSAAKNLGKAVQELRRAPSDLKNQFEGEMMDIGRNAERAPGPSLPPAPVSRSIPPQAVPPPVASLENIPGLDAARAEPAGAWTTLKEPMPEPSRIP